MKQTRAAEFVGENLKTIFAYALSRVSDRNDAEDLTNDIVTAILQSADKMKNDDAFYGYVWAIAANTYRKFIRNKSRHLFDEIDDSTPDTYDFTEAMSVADDIRRLRREIAMLSKEYRECTVAYYFDGLSCAAVSEKTGISPEMVKYYLFKTRKILKEGICMEREFGEKSFRPAPFEFVTIFSGAFNREYIKLFSRKLPGQILLSAYYTPMTARELTTELGVASVYLEDELDMLEKYGLISKSPKGRYQTNLIIFTDDFKREFNAEAAKLAERTLAGIISGAQKRLPEIRALNRFCAQLSDERLLWSLIWPVMRQGNSAFGQKYPGLAKRDMLYDGATGTNYGVSHDRSDGTLDRFGCYSFAGYAGIDDEYFARAADFNILPEKNRFFTVDRNAFAAKLHRIVDGEEESEFMILTEAEEAHLFDILSAEISQMAALYDRMFKCACTLMHSHAPKSVGAQIDRIMYQTLFFETVGLIGACAVSSGALNVPDFGGAAAMYVRENTKAAEESINQGVMV